MYWAAEDSNFITRNCLGGYRPFEMRIMDSYQNEVIHLDRLARCDSCCFPCCLQVGSAVFPLLLSFHQNLSVLIEILLLQKMEVSAPPGNLIGTVEQEWSLLSPKFNVKDAYGETVLKIEGPFCRIAFCGAADFQVRRGNFRVEEDETVVIYIVYKNVYCRYCRETDKFKWGKSARSGQVLQGSCSPTRTTLEFLFRWIWTWEWKPSCWEPCF